MRKRSLGSAVVSSEEVPVPRCGANNVLIANRYSLISAGTESMAVGSTKRDMVVKAIKSPDIRQSVVDMVVQDGVRKTADRVKFEFNKWTPLGYSGAGIALEVGDQIETVRPGDLVAYAGEPHAEIIRARKRLTIPVPKGVSAAEAAFVALGGIALQAVRRAEPQMGETIAVLGLGLVGQLVSQLLSAMGVRVIGSDLLDGRLKLAERLGIEKTFVAGEDFSGNVIDATSGIGVDRVMICAAGKSNVAVQQAVKVARDRGRVVVVGLVGLEIPCEEFYMKELDLVISRSYGPGRYDPSFEDAGKDYPRGYVRWTEERNMAEFLRLVGEGRVNLKPLISHEFEIDQAATAYSTVMDKPNESLAVMLKYGDEEPKETLRVVPASTKKVAVSKGKAQVAIIGCGNFAQQFHLPNIQAHKQLDFRRLVTSTGQSSKEMAERYGAAESSTDIQSLWQMDDLDAVFVFTRDKSHASIAADALRSGKHVFCEKPLACSEQDCEMLEQVAASANTVCFTGFNRRFAPMVVRMKTTLDRLTGPKVIQMRVNAGSLPLNDWVYDEQHAAGRIVGEACHFIDLLRWLVGEEPTGVAAIGMSQGSANQLEDISAQFLFPDGSIGSLIYTAVGNKLVGKERFEVFCDGTSIILDDYKQLTIRGADRVDLTAKKIDKGHAAELDHFANVVNGNVQSDITIQDGISATRWALSIMRAAREH